MSTTEMKEIINKLYANIRVIDCYVNHLDDADDDLREEILEDLDRAVTRMHDRTDYLGYVVDEAKGVNTLLLFFSQYLHPL